MADLKILKTDSSLTLYNGESSISTLSYGNESFSFQLGERGGSYYSNGKYFSMGTGSGTVTLWTITLSRGGGNNQQHYLVVSIKLGIGFDASNNRKGTYDAKFTWSPGTVETTPPVVSGTPVASGTASMSYTITNNVIEFTVPQSLSYAMSGSTKIDVNWKSYNGSLITIV